jgi:superfamily II DNA/RNA helicase
MVYSFKLVEKLRLFLTFLYKIYIMNEIKLTEEQKKCAEYPLDQKILVINADPGTGKTEVLKQRVLFIHDYLSKTESDPGS